MPITELETAFPKFDEIQLEAVGNHGELTSFEPDQMMFEQGQKDYPFFVIKSGEVRIVEKCGEHENLIKTHGPGAFTGDVDMLTGRSAVVTAIASTPVQAYRLCAGRLRKLLGSCPTVSDTLLEAFQQRRRLLEASDFVGVRLVGNVNHAPTTRLREFFYKNHVPHRFYDADDDTGQQQLACLEAAGLELPVVHCNGHTIGNPSLPDLAECIGISRDVDQQLFDLVIVGCGPAGLAAAVYAASEGISTLVIDAVGPGGQASSSSRIENFMGFPSGLSGSELANRGYLQALKFGAKFIAPITVHSISQDPSGEHHLRLCTGQTARARSVLISTGVTYRQLGLPGCQNLEGAGVYYAATSVEARVCANSTVVIVGGGNSAGQAAMFLAESARRVIIAIRGTDLGKSMSAYLCERIEKHSKIEVLQHAQVSQVNGEQCVESIAITRGDGTTEVVDCAALFIFIGARPHTDWLPESLLLDEKGFVLTGSAVESAGAWSLDRPPCDLETSVPGIMAAGDVRSGTTKRCGFAVGDGSLAIACVHRYLNELV